jgi:hypothetical protein
LPDGFSSSAEKPSVEKPYGFLIFALHGEREISRVIQVLPLAVEMG